MTQEVWKKCSSCKKDIHYGQRYYICSVSSCQGQRTGYAFCSVPCFEVHLPSARHKDAAALEERAPNTNQMASSASISSNSNQQRRIVRPTSTSSPNPTSGTETPKSHQSLNGLDHEVLIVVSKLKKFVKAASDMNTSDGVTEPLSNFVRKATLKAIEKARQDGRKTLLARDFQDF